MCISKLLVLPPHCCQHCGLPLSIEKKHCWQCALVCRYSERTTIKSLWVYLGMAKRLLRLYKEHCVKPLAYFFAHSLALLLLDCIAIPQKKPTPDQFSGIPFSMPLETLSETHTSQIVVCPIPSSPYNTYIRQFDHMSLIAKHVAKELSCILKTNVHFATPFKRSWSSAQKKLEYGKRFSNVKNSFSIKKNLIDAEWQKSTIFVIDDVITTGATAQTCMTMLEDTMPNANKYFVSLMRVL